MYNKALGKLIYFLFILLQRFEIPGVVHLKLAAILKLSSLLAYSAVPLVIAGIIRVVRTFG